MDHTLTCNNLKCRGFLEKEALVTTCSHMFCMECAGRLGFQTHDGRHPVCPACKTQLSSTFDAVVTNLNPSEDYKTSILSGLGPSVIMECASRALSFWAYQTTQDVYYQQYQYKTLNDKFSELSHRLEKTINDANSEIDALQQKMANLATEQDSLRRRNDELAQAYKDKSRKLLQTQELYDRVKRKAEMGQIEQAASEAVDLSLPIVPQMSHTFNGTMNNISSGSHVMTSYGQTHQDDTVNVNTGFPRLHNTKSQQWSKTGSPFQLDFTNHSVGGPRRQGFGSSSQWDRPAASHPPRRTKTPTQTIRAGQHSATPNVQGFAGNRAGLAGVGLTSGLKVSQPTSALGLDVATRRV